MMPAATATAARMGHASVDHGLEPGAVYRLPSGRMARFDGADGEGLLFRTVDVHRMLVVQGEAVHLTERMARHARVAWHADQWGRRCEDRRAQEAQRVADAVGLR